MWVFFRKKKGCNSHTYKKKKGNKTKKEQLTLLQRALEHRHPKGMKCQFHSSEEATALCDTNWIIKMLN